MVDRSAKIGRQKRTLEIIAEPARRPVIRLEHYGLPFHFAEENRNPTLPGSGGWPAFTKEQPLHVFMRASNASIGSDFHGEGCNTYRKPTALHEEEESKKGIKREPGGGEGEPHRFLAGGWGCPARVRRQGPFFDRARSDAIVMGTAPRCAQKIAATSPPRARSAPEKVSRKEGQKQNQKSRREGERK
ncbi:hypothetical protein HPB51_005336 [Rhipicephalus microplus]|uniref:Uncharacterized protein n=1 Tax=Rhipicephalus microplus TaxID=6941 RepID=A0A9J6EYU4_RHIMP|nr:hypothetical protein HPB51_005336 [Rhipicephalus microplus]